MIPKKRGQQAGPDGSVITDGFSLNWLRVLGTAEPSQIDYCVCHQLHAVVPLLDALEPQQEPFEFIFPRQGPLDAHT